MVQSLENTKKGKGHYGKNHFSKTFTDYQFTCIYMASLIFYLLILTYIAT